MNLSNLKIGTKLMLGFASVLALTTLLGVMALLPAIQPLGQNGADCDQQSAQRPVHV